jgi:DNA-binding transcriptional regulator YiaG
MTNTEKPPDPTVERIRALMARKDWTAYQTAHYLGVPLSTLGNWTQGTKAPSAAVARLLDVLNTVEFLAPHIHANLIPES